MHIKKRVTIIILLAISLIIGCGDNRSNHQDTTTASSSSETVSSEPFESAQITSTNLREKTLVQNKAAYITSQCYTKTKDENGGVHNPCMNCHVHSKEPNYLDDYALQETYAYTNDYTRVNHFTNLFKDRTDAVDAISDEAILEYVRHDNYKDDSGRITLAEQLKHLPETWDYNENGTWDGYTPDCEFNFDDEGFDKSNDNNYTGWRAFAYYPFLGTFWPTNGSTDDVLIRLSEVFRQDASGNFSLEAYKINLAVVEAMIKENNITIDATDETQWGVDLDKDGTLATATQVTYDWAPLENRYMSYVGKAKTEYDAIMASSGYMPMAAGLYPAETEFLHSVRYIDVVDGTPTMAARMKELRYARKYSWNTYPQLQNAVNAEIKEKHDFPERLRTIIGNVEQGVQTSYGWVYQGFIEDKEGYLRPQTYEESIYCVGCHSTMGAIVDSTFVFARKFDHTQHQMGWYHWTQKADAFKNLKEPRLADGRYEYSLYLEHNHAGDEFRDNQEVMDKFFDANGTLKSDAVSALHSDVSSLIIPSATRALTLNKAYKVIVDEQSYIYGRDAHVSPVSNVYEEVEMDQETGNSAVEMERYPLQ